MGGDLVADWEKIKAEYVTTEISVRELAQKYGVHYTTIGKKASKEGWQELRQQQTNATLTKILTAVSDQKVDRAKKLYDATDELLDKIVAGIGAVSVLSASAAKNYSDALKNIKDIKMIKSEEDIEEQRARIAKLQKEAEKSDKNEGFTITFEGGTEDYVQ